MENRVETALEQRKMEYEVLGVEWREIMWNYENGDETGPIQYWCYSQCRNWSCAENNLSCVKN